MPFPGALTATQLAAIRRGGLTTNQYLLIWDNPIIFQAQINQASFDSSFATLTYNNVTVGAFGDIQSDFVCVISQTAGDLQDPEQVFRIRADGSYVVADGTTININQTSAALTDDWYIMVVKDVRLSAKLPFTVEGATPSANTYLRDFEITFRRLLPVVYGLATAYANTVDDSGNYDLVLAPSVLLSDDNATSAVTWLWDIDGGAFQVGSSSTQNITARFSATGNYMPRVIVTDNLGNKGYFTFKVFVVPQDFSTVVNLAFDAVSITTDTQNSGDIIVNANATSNRDLITRIDLIDDLTFCAVWFPTNQPAITSDIMFVGRFARDTVNNDFSPDGNTILSTSFQLEGITSQLGRITSRRLPIIEDDTPTVFGEMEKATPWRAVVYFITEHTTLANVHSLQFGDVTDVYRYPRFGTQDSSALDSMIDLIFTINGAINYAASGELFIDRIAWYLTDAARTALTTVIDFVLSDMATDENGGALYSRERTYYQTIGREMGGGGVYDSTTKEVQVLKAITPAVAQGDGNELATYNRQILLTNTDFTVSSAELGQRTTDDEAARQPQTILRASFPASYYQAIQPHSSLWYTFTIPASSNNRGISYTSANRWTCQSKTVAYDLPNGRFLVNAVFKLETQGGDYQTVVSTPLDAGVHFFNPVVPVVPTYANFPEEANSNLSDPTTPTQESEPPFSGQDVSIVISPIDPSVTAANTSDGARGMVWDLEHVWGVENIPNTPTFTDFTPPSLVTSGEKITNGKFDPFTAAALIISNDTVGSGVWRTKAFGVLQWVKKSIANVVYKHILMLSVVGRVVLTSWEGTSGFSADYDYLTSDEGFATYDIASAPGSQEVGTYTLGTGWTQTIIDYGDVVAGVAIVKTIARSLITRVTVNYTAIESVNSDATGFGIRIILWDGPVVIGAGDYDSGGVDQWGTDQERTFIVGGIYATNISVLSFSSNNNTGTDLSDAVVEIQTMSVRAGEVETRYSEDLTVTLDGARVLGALTAEEAGVAHLRAGSSTTDFVAIDDSIETSTSGGAYSTEADGDTTGSYAKSIVGFYGTGFSYIYGTAAAIGGETTWLVDDSAKSPITPNDGVDDGIVVSGDALAVVAGRDDQIVGLFLFDATVKLAYTGDQGATWAFNTQVSTSANYIRMKLIGNGYNIYITDGVTLWWGVWDGTTADTIVLQAKTSPSAALLGVEIK